MPLRLSPALLFAVLLLPARAALPLPEAAPATAGFSPARLETLHKFFDQVVAQKQYPGAITVIARQGRIVDWRQYGTSDLAGRHPMQADTIFRLYSMTKPIVSVAVLQLMEEGKLTLEDPVSLYLPEFKAMTVYSGAQSAPPPAKNPITIRQLLTHTSGLTRPTPGNPGLSQLYRDSAVGNTTTLADYTRALAALPLACEPGTEFHYGASTDVLGRVIEVVSGQSFENFLRERIFTPLGMKDTGFTVPPEQRGRLAEMATTTPEGQLASFAFAPGKIAGELVSNIPSGGGGLYSTAGDYLRFAQMLLNGGELDGVSILGRKTVELMLQNHLTQLSPPVHEFSPAEGFGLGGYVVLDVARRGRPGSVGQFGWSGAGSTYFTIDPQEKLVAILMMQHLPQDPLKVNGKFYTLVYQALVP